MTSSPGDARSGRQFSVQLGRGKGPPLGGSRLRDPRFPNQRIDSPHPLSTPNFADTELPTGAGRQDPAKQVQIDDQGNDEH